MNTIKPMPADLYHADYSAWSRSMLSTFRESKREAYMRYVERSAPEEKAKTNMKLGSLAHTMLLEPDKLDSTFKVIPKDILAKNGAISTSAAKEFVADCANEGIAAIKQDTWDESANIVDSVRKVCGKWLEKAAQVEHAIYWTDPITKLPCKARPDFIVPTPTEDFIFDLKTTTRIIPHTFSKVVETHEYWLQECHYRQGYFEATGRRAQMFFIGIEQGWPYRAGLFQLSQETKDKAFECWRYLLNDVAKAIESNQWDDPWEKDITILNLKDYVFRSAS